MIAATASTIPIPEFTAGIWRQKILFFTSFITEAVCLSDTK